MLSPSNRVSPGQQGVSKVSDTLGPALVLDTDAVLEIVGQAAQWSENGVIVFDPSGNCQWVNHSSSRSLGPGEEASLVGRLNLWEHCFIPEDPQQRKLEEALNGRYVEVPELHYHPTGGGAPAVTGEDFSCPSDCFKVSAQLFPLLDLGGKPVALYVFNSASPNPEAEGDARFASEPHLAQTIQVAKRFSRKTAHDFNNITAVVQGFASILLNRLPKDDANRNLVEQIEASAQDALKLTSWLSGFANVRPAEPVEVDFNGMVQEFLAVCRDQKPENVELKVDLASQLPGVLADESHLEEVLRHLWQNSVEALAEGGTLQWQTSLEPLPDPTAQGVDRCSPASYLRLRVKDTGVGMEQPTLQAMLEPFFSTKPGKNRGLGLAVVYDIVSAHHGLICASSQPGEGTCVDIYLPTQETAPSQSGGAIEPASVQRSQQLLVVDDEEVIRLLVQQILKDQDYQVVGVGSGEAALEAYRQSGGAIKAVILDMALPDMDGLETFRSLKELDSQIKVIVSTGDPHQQAVHDAMAQGAYGVLAKPFRAEHLVEVVKQAFS